ncbi:MAG: O-antigen ligase family protein [Thermaurantimonas sp.]
MRSEAAGIKMGYLITAVGVVYYTILLPFQPTFLPASIGMMFAGIGWIYMLFFDFKNTVFNKKSFLVVVLMALYFLSGISYIDDPMYREVMSVQIPLLFWGLPFVIHYQAFREKILPILLKYFILSSVLSALIFILFFLWTELKDVSIEYSKRSPYYFLPVHYLGMYFNGALVFLLWGSFFKKKNHIYSIFIILSIAVILLSSRMQWFIYLMLLIAFFTHAFFQKKIPFNPKAVLLFLITLLVFSQIPEVKRRILETSDEFRSMNTKVNDKQTNHRKFIWKESLSVIKEMPAFGFKPGVADQLLMSRLSTVEEEFWDGTQVYYLRDGHYNYHNQFLQAIAERGIGVLGLIGMLLFTFFSTHSIMTRMFVFVVFLSMLTESILQRQSGVFFVAFFIPLLAAFSDD